MTETRRNSRGEVLGPRERDDLSYDDRQLGTHNTPHDAQPDNLATDRAVSMLEESAATLQTLASVLRSKMPRGGRVEVRRQLSGVVGKCESVRSALRRPGDGL